MYIGQTDNVQQRLKRHNGEIKNKLTSYTNKQGKGWKLLYSEQFNTRKEALSREKALKQHKGRDWLRKIIPGL